MDERIPTPRETPGLARRSVQLGLVATLVALLPLVLLARLTMARAQDAVHDEVGVRLRVTTAMAASLLAEQLAGFVTLVEAEAKHPRLVRAVATDRGRFDAPAVERELAALLASRDGLAGTGLVDLAGVLRGSPVAPELVGKDFSTRDYYKGLVAAGDTYVSEAFVSAQAGHPFVVTVSTYVRAPSTDGRTPGKPLAILLLGVELDAVQPLADSVAAAQGVNLWVADQHGKLLAAPGGRPPGLEPVTREPIGQAASLRAGQPADVDLGGAAMTVVHRRVDPLGWTVFAAVPHAEAYRGVEAIRTTMLAIAIPLSVIVCCGIVVLVRLQRRQWRAEAALEVARDQARDASRLKTEFLSRISHELRTPLNAILGFGQLLQLDDLTEEQRESVDQILRGGRRTRDDYRSVNRPGDVVVDATGKVGPGRPVSAQPVALLRRTMPVEQVHRIGPPACGTGDCFVRAEANAARNCPYEHEVLRRDPTPAEQRAARRDARCDGVGGLYRYFEYLVTDGLTVVVDPGAVGALTGLEAADTDRAAAALRAGKVVVDHPRFLHGDQVRLTITASQPGAKEKDRTRTVTAPGYALPHRPRAPITLMTWRTARSLGLDPVASMVLATTSRMPTVAEQDRLQAALHNTAGVYVERGPRSRSDTRTLLLLAVVAGVVTLGAAAIATGLAAADGRADLGTLAAVGASPGSGAGCR